MSGMTLADFSEKTLELGTDYEGRVIATLISSNWNKPGCRPVLYLHGFNDYFFQAHLAEEFHSHGYNFYALDLRKYGRSLLPHQHPNYCRSITEYFEEIDRSIEIINTKNELNIILLGHSTGGLIASVYLNTGQYKDHVEKLVLNSPFLEFNINFWQRMFLLPMAGIVSLLFPYSARKKPFSHLYGASLSDEEHGEWNFNTDWKPIEGFPAYFKWVYAVNRAQKKLHMVSNIKVPILILHSDSSSTPKNWNDILLKTDMVLNIDHIKKFGKKLGPDVTFTEIPEAIHDVFLSPKNVRKQAFEQMFNWLK
ncbi:alpha/beta hydrolase [Gracilimonas sp.]|uniref:alpha/beta hydrolase n=1 Tax=Gracilimonas sp. TaxID=1974203 RepID=UPI0025C0F29F|nr:alpha/beta hydrolase [Gracilimonas sp.]